MRVLKEVLVLAALVLVLAYAARLLEGVDAGKFQSGVPSLSELLDRFWSTKGDEPATHGSKESAPAR